MNLKSTSLTALVAATALLSSCNQFKVTKTDDGDRYQIHEEGDSKQKAKEGDIISFDLVIKSESNDTLTIVDSYKNGEPFEIALQKGPFKGSFENGLFYIAEGDSATIFVKADSLYTKAQQPLPPGVTAGSDLKFIVKMRKVMTAEEFAQETEKKKADEGKIIADYVAKSMAGAQKDENGIYSVVNKPGSGAAVMSGDTVTVHYKGTLLSGEEFDSSIGGEPIKFPVGMNYVIPGWEKALMAMKPGEKRTVVIPSELAYGPAGAGGIIKPFSPLRFEMELVKVNKGGK